jgi:hypothetical protein
MRTDTDLLGYKAVRAARIEFLGSFTSGGSLGSLCCIGAMCALASTRLTFFSERSGTT